ncbi:MAG: DUF2202 domain-containing protein [Actinobacteria bacterium]|nr:DUF2202 domain-containing protein [Actinomycetota bacterium]
MTLTWIRRAAVAASAAALALLGWTGVAQAAPTPVPPPAVTATGGADAALAESLTSLREEEKLARDVYTALAAAHDQSAPFVNIARSEQRHYDTVGLLLSRYGIADPAAGRAAGSYADPDFQALYASLVATGTASLAGAYEVGITIETTDIADLEATLAGNPPADVTAALTTLLNGSRNHLAAFTAAKDGRALGARDGRGMRNGRAAGSATAPGGGAGTASAPGRAGGQRRAATDRPSTCPIP